MAAKKRKDGRDVGMAEAAVTLALCAAPEHADMRLRPLAQSATGSGPGTRAETHPQIHTDVHGRGRLCQLFLPMAGS